MSAFENFLCKYISASTLLGSLAVTHVIFSVVMFIAEKEKNKKETEETDQLFAAIEVPRKIIIQIVQKITEFSPSLPWIISIVVCSVMLYIIKFEVSITETYTCQTTEKTPAPVPLVASTIMKEADVPAGAVIQDPVAVLPP